MTGNPRADILDDALGYHDRGWSCIPIRHYRTRAGEIKKQPPIKYKEFKERMPARGQLREWFTDPKLKVDGVAVITGKVSGNLAAREFDSHESYSNWCEGNSALACTIPTAKSHKGFHIYAESDLHRDIELGGGEWYRCNGLIVAPHSLHYEGTRYEWIRPLPKGRLPQVDHAALIGRHVTENNEAVSLSRYHSFPLINILSIDQVIERTLPTKAGERSACILKLARGMKFNAGMSKASIAELNAVVRRWFERAKSVVRTQEIEITLGDFEDAFRTAKYPLDYNHVDEAANRIDRNDLGEVAMQYEGPTMRMLVALCEQIAKINGGTFFLTCPDAAARLNTTAMTIWRLYRQLERDRRIECMERGRPGVMRGTRYRWIGNTPEAHP